MFIADFSQYENQPGQLTVLELLNETLARVRVLGIVHEETHIGYTDIPMGPGVTVTTDNQSQWIIEHWRIDSQGDIQERIHKRVLSLRTENPISMNLQGR